MSSVEFFGKVDKGQKGEISSQFPAWYFESHLDELRESIARKERSLKRGDIPPDSIPETRAELAKESERLKAIEGSKPTLSDQEKNLLYKCHKSLGSKIQDSMFTRSEMMMGTASPHEEAKRMSQPIIVLSKEELSLAKGCGVTVDDKNMVSRNAASRIFKMVGKLIDQPTNIEVLRKDKATPGSRNKVSVAA
jgi:hypothetical protein